MSLHIASDTNTQVIQDKQSDGQTEHLNTDMGALSHLATSVQSLESSMKEHAKLLAESRKSLDAFVQGQASSNQIFPYFHRCLRGPSPGNGQGPQVLTGPGSRVQSNMADTEG